MSAQCLLSLLHPHPLLKLERLWELGGVGVGVVFLGPCFPSHRAAGSSDSCMEVEGWGKWMDVLGSGS